MRQFISLFLVLCTGKSFCPSCRRRNLVCSWHTHTHNTHPTPYNPQKSQKVTSLANLENFCDNLNNKYLIDCICTLCMTQFSSFQPRASQRCSLLACCLCVSVKTWISLSICSYFKHRHFPCKHLGWDSSSAQHKSICMSAGGYLCIHQRFDSTPYVKISEPL